MNGAPYLSSDDSALLRRAIEGRTGDVCLEMGAGNGGTLVELSGRFGGVAGTDLVRPRMMDWSRGADFALADRASCFRAGVFDLVTFNPPYLGGAGTGDMAVDGGEELETPLSFLEEALRVVSKKGRVIFLLNQEADLSVFEERCRRQGFELHEVASRRLFFERLSVYEAAPRGEATRTLWTSETAGSAQDETSTASRLHPVPASPS